MERKVFYLIAGTVLFAPCFLALCCNSFAFAFFALVYGVLLWMSPRMSPRIKVFWRKFWRASLELESTMFPKYEK